MNPESLESALIQLTRDLVLIENIDAKPKERRRCFQLARNHLDELNSLNFRSYESNGYESLIVLPEGIDAPETLFCAHLDVIDHSGAEHYRSEIREGRIYGPGAGDMKGALAIILTLFRNLMVSKPETSVGLAITSDEEKGGENGARFLVEDVGLKAGAVIIPDGGSIDRITLEEKGILHLKIIANGESAHAARPWLGKNPIPAIMAGIQDLQSKFQTLQPQELLAQARSDREHWYPTCTVTGLSTPTESINCVPDFATANLDIRFTNPHTVESMLSFIRETLDEEIEVHLIVGAEPTHLAPDQRFLDTTETIIGRKPALARVSGGSDARFFAHQGIPVMLSRPIVGNLHGHDEWIDIQSMMDYYRICERYILDSST